MHPFLNIADKAARLAGQRILYNLKRIDRLEVYEKSANSFVTAVDYEVEKLLVQTIREAYPTHAIISEECGKIGNDSDYVWIIDPLDGTTNFIHGLPPFAISMAVQYKGRLEQALVYDPLAKETFYASRGQGAQLNQRRLRVTQHTHLKRSLLYVNSPPAFSKELKHWMQIIQSISLEPVGIRNFGSAALGLAYVAAGRLDGFISSTALKLWDMAAGALLVQEAGGIVCDESGGSKYLETGKIIAANLKLSEHLVKINRNLT